METITKSEQSAIMKRILIDVLEFLARSEDHGQLKKLGWTRIDRGLIDSDKQTQTVWDNQFANIMTAIQNRGYHAGFVVSTWYPKKQSISVYKQGIKHNESEIVFPPRLIDCEPDSRGRKS